MKRATLLLFLLLCAVGAYPLNRYLQIYPEGGFGPLEKYMTDKTLVNSSDTIAKYEIPASVGNEDFSLCVKLSAPDTHSRHLAAGVAVGALEIMFTPTEIQGIIQQETHTSVTVVFQGKEIAATDIPDFPGLLSGSLLRVNRQKNNLTISIKTPPGGLLKKIIPSKTIDVFAGEVPRDDISSIALLASPGGVISPRAITLIYEEPKAIPDVLNDYSLENLIVYIQHSTDAIEGFYRLLDREMNEDISLCGGNYTLAVIKADEETYDIIYIDGAATNISGWEPGMMKGRLKNIGLWGVFDVEWTGSEFSVVGKDARATYSTDLPSLTFSFPYQEAKLRFFKLSPEKISLK